MTPGAQLRLLRQRNGLTQRELAEPEYTRTYLSQVELDREEPTPEAMRHFAQRLGVSAALTAKLVQARKLLTAGDIEPARVEYSAILTQAALFGLNELQYAAAYGLGEASIHIGRFATALERFTEAAALAGDEQSKVAALARKITCLALAGDPVNAVALGEAVLGRADRNDQAAQARLLAALIMPYAQLGAFERVSEASRQALALAPRVRDDAVLAYLHRAVTHTFIEQHHFDEALAHADRAMRLSEKLNVPIDVGLCRLASASALKDADRLAEAAEELTAAIEIFRSVRADAYRDRATAVLAEVRLLQGNAKLARQLAGEVTESDPWTAGYVRRIAGIAAAESGDAVEAERLLQQSAELFAAQGGRVDLVETCREWGRLLVTQGRLEEAVDVYDRGLRGASTVAQA